MEEIRFSHVSVLLRECIEALRIKPNGIYVDCTTGGGGHSLEIAKRLTDGGRLIAIDRDEDALRAAGVPVETGVFGADMQIETVCDGPVTIVADSAMWKA